MSYNFKTVEPEVREFWEKNDIYSKAKKKVQGGPKEYYLDGPPYTSGHVHIGTAWNKALKDTYLRYKRMCGYDIWDRAGYDMHGLPTERAVERQLNVFGKEAIREYGVDKFVQLCKQTCIDNAKEMSETFKYMGVWMDFERAYQSVEKEYIEGVWWFIKKAAEAGRLYEAEKTMTWDAVNSTALAKHELEYKEITHDAIFVRFPVVMPAERASEPQEYLVIWTTTPWTIPFNLGVMAGPEFDYVKVDVEHEGRRERWIIAEALVQKFLVGELGKEEGSWSVAWRGKGKELEGLSYTHPFAGDFAVYGELKARMPRVHTVLLSAQYVDTESGTGLVHCAPGCGPEDYVVGKLHGIEPFNTVDEGGVVRNLGAPLDGLRAKVDDAAFIEAIRARGALVAKTSVTHDYPFGERSQKPVIFRTTKQWFLRVEDMKDKLLEAAREAYWNPPTAKNAFLAWVQNLRDNSISKQRFWGTPLPIWRSEDDAADFFVVGDADELCALAGLPQGSLADLHPPVVDKIAITRVSERDGKEHVYRRVPDILDVWVDAGSACFNCLRMPGESFATGAQRHAEMAPAEFILEGRDQIRGWFNLLHLESMVLFGRPAFKNVYMHGFICDAQGRKMSKSLGNYILPAEVWDKYGVDTLRYYSISAANPGDDLNYNMKDVDVCHRNLSVFWNVASYLFVNAAALADTASPVPIADLLRDKGAAALGIEERYILSRLHWTLREVEAMFAGFRINKVPGLVEAFLLEVSHVYIQLVWEKKDTGAPAEKQAVLSTLAECVSKGAAMLAPFCPFIAEKIYQLFRSSTVPGIAAFAPEESVHLVAWPHPDPAFIDPQLEADVNAAKDAVAAVLAARDKANLAVKQPSRAVRVACPPRMVPLLQRTADLITGRTNVKSLGFEPPADTITVAPNQRTIGKQFGRNRKLIATYIEAHAAELAAALASVDRAAGAVWSAEIAVEGIEGPVTLHDDHLVVAHGVPKEWAMGKAGEITAYLDTTRTEELELEGRVRELARKIQVLRKKGGLDRADRARVEIAIPEAGQGAQPLAKVAKDNAPFLCERTGSTEVIVTLCADPKTAFEGREDCIVSSVEKVGKLPISFALLK